ncbi:MAG: tetratricopeptide repeat protein, partial [Chthoniobacterales bacterium]
VADFFTLTKQCERAIPLYQRVLSSDPDFGGALENLALCYARSGKSKEAIDTYQQVIDKDATKIGAYDEIADLAIQMGDNNRALTALRQAMLMDASDPMRYEKAGDCALKLSKIDDAVKIFTEARIRFPSEPEFTHFLGIALSQANRHAEAMQVFERAIFEAGNQRPGMLDSHFYCDYGMAAEEAKQYGKAEEMLKKSIDMDPDHAAESYNALGYMWVDRGERLDEAEVVIRKAVEIDPNNAMYIDSLGWLLYKQGKYQDAVAQLQRASELLSNHPDAVVFEHIGDAYQKLGQFAQAVLYWQKSIGLDPKNKVVLAKIDDVSKKVVDQKTVTTP